jgi:hypothetical protein
MSFQPISTQRKAAPILARLLLWLVAAFSLGDLAPAFAESQRSGERLLKESGWSQTIDQPDTVVVSNNDADPETPALAGGDAGIDVDDASPLPGVHAWRRASAHGAISSSQCEGATPSVVFQSRAPPALA